MSPTLVEYLYEAYLADRNRETAALALLRMARRAPAVPRPPRADRSTRGLRGRRPIAWFVREA